MQGSRILINGNEPKGRFMEGIANDGTIAPGMAIEIVAGVAPVNGRFTFRRVTTASGAQGQSRLKIIATEDTEQGVVPALNGTNLYSSGYRMFAYCPLPGDELNLLVETESGTGHHFAIGDLLEIDVTTSNGRFILRSGTDAIDAVYVDPNITTPLSADTLCWCIMK